MSKSQSNFELARINAEGELIGGVFCAYCGGLNRADAAECEHCHEHIADQGPDLHSRLQRIHRRASSSGGFSDIADGGIGSVTERPSIKTFAGRSILSILSIPLRALRAGSFARLTELGAVLGSVFFLLCMVAFLIVPSRGALFVVIFFAIAALSCTIVSFMLNAQDRPVNQREDQKINGTTVGPHSTPVRWDTSQLIARLASKIFEDTRFLTALAMIIVLVLVVLIFGLVTLPLAR